MNTFSALGLSQPVVNAVADLGFETPTPIQSQAIPQLLSKKTDLVGLAQTGTGKTAAFGLPLVDLVDPAGHTQALVLAPTRELCMQITKELKLFAKFKSGLRILPVYGGADIGKQIREVKRGVQILVATPGRLRDLMRRKVVDIRNIDYVVLDEADEMLNMGFKEEIDEILEVTNADKQTWLFSATMPKEVRRIAKAYMSDPLELQAGSPKEAHADIDHRYLITHAKDRPGVLRQFLDAEPDVFALVFTRTRKDAQDLADELTRNNYFAEALHGGMTQSQRDRVMDRFRSRHLKILIATDVAARGIDVQDITHVFHFNLPQDYAFYTHRSGRTGRAGSKGTSIALVHPKDKKILRQIERVQQVKFSPIEVPSGQEVVRRQLLGHVNEIVELKVNGEMEPFMPEMLEQLEGLSKEDLVKRFTAYALGDRLELLKQAKSKNKERGDASVEWLRMFINIGRMDISDKGAFLSLICEQAKIPGSAIGKIDLQKTHTIFDIDRSYRRKVAERFSGSSYQGRPIRVNEAEGGQKVKKGKKKKSKRKGQFRKARKK